MYDRLGELVGEAPTPSTSCQCKLELLDRMSDVLDRTMIEASSPPLTGSPTSGYRLMEHAYKALLNRVPREIRRVMPPCDQVP